jgi:hypothetical protein
MSLHHHATSARREHTIPSWPVVLVLCVCAALAAATGCSSSGAPSGDAASGGASSSATTGTSPTPIPSPVVSSGRPPAAAVDVVRMFWTLIGEGRVQEARNFVIAPGSPLLDWTGDDIAAARLVRVLHGSIVAPTDGATMTFAADVWIRPSGVTPWGEVGKHTLFMSVVRMSDGSWRAWAVNTSP